MSQRPDTPMLDQVQIPADLKRFTDQELKPWQMNYVKKLFLPSLRLVAI